MRIKALFLLLGFCSSILTAQTPRYILLKKTALGHEIGYQNQEKIDPQIASLLQRSLGSLPAFSVFALEPRLNVLEEGKIEGLQSRPTVKLNLACRIVNLYSGEAFGSFEIALVGSGANRDEAVRKAIGNLRSKEAVFSKNVEAAQGKISEYYASNCGNIVAQAKSLEAEQKLGDALTLLHGIPSDAPCYAEADALKTSIFQKTQSLRCKQVLQSADARAASNDFPGALSVLAQVDAGAPCFEDAKAKIASLETKVDDELKNRYEWLFKFYQTGAEADKARWNALAAFCIGHLRESGRWEGNLP